ncbi:hypothetical protein [Bacillus infantis]
MMLADNISEVIEMSRSYYNQCRGGMGRMVRIRTVHGREHVGVIERVTPSKVFIRPAGGRNYGGHGYGEFDGFAYPYGWGWGWGGFGIGIAFGAIAALAFVPFLW